MTAALPTRTISRAAAAILCEWCDRPRGECDCLGWCDEHAMMRSECDCGDPAADALAREVRRQRLRQAATDYVAAGAPAPPFDAGLLSDVLARPDVERWRVADLLPAEGRMLLVAQRKTGKTTATLNLARDLLLGGDFLGRFRAEPIAGRIGFLNYEVSAGQLARWAHEVGVPVERMLLVNLRGRRNPLGRDDDRAELVALLREHEVGALIVDPFGRAYTGASQNDPGEVGAFLVALDLLATEAGASELILTAHAGWNGERTRGSSALEDWADVVATLVRDDDSGHRFLRAMGRDVEVDEDRLDYDPETRRLVMAGTGSRKADAAAARLEHLVGALVDVVTERPGCSVRDVERTWAEAGIGHQKGDGNKASAEAERRGRVTRTKGARGALTHHLPPPTPTYPDGAPATYPDRPYKGGVGRGVPEPSTYPEDHPACAACSTPLAAADLMTGAELCGACEVAAGSAPAEGVSA
jgi:hypothetical protein